MCQLERIFSFVPILFDSIERKLENNGLLCDILVCFDFLLDEGNQRENL